MVTVGDSILSSCGRPLSDDSYRLDLDTFIFNLIFFDRLIINSTRLLEVPALCRSIGIDNLQELFNSGLVKTYCDAREMASVGQNIYITENSGGPLPDFHFDIRPMAVVHDKYLHD
jgi:hypothetical protein